MGFSVTQQTSPFDRIIDRRSSESNKWHRFDPDVLPMWVADMDFTSPQPVIDALRERVEHGVYGYGQESEELRRVIVERVARLYDWTIQPDDVMFLPNVAVSFNLASHALTSPGDKMLMQPPIYFPLLRVPENVGIEGELCPLVQEPSGRYAIDFEALEAAISKQTKLFILCNPHNPVGRVYSREELERIAEICLRHDVAICSDEIHADFIYSGNTHVPIASLSPEVAQNTVTILSSNKTFNLAGISCAVVIVPNATIRERMMASERGLIPHVGIMGFTAALAAYEHGDPWLRELLAYLEENRNYVDRYVAENLPGMRSTPIEGTFLSWLDCRDLDLDESPSEFFLREARVAMNEGAMFGQGGETFVRFNFGCPRATVIEGLERIKRAIS